MPLMYSGSFPPHYHPRPWQPFKNNININKENAITVYIINMAKVQSKYKYLQEITIIVIVKTNENLL